jgi:hypothetical protein
MSDDRTFERDARAWLELGPTQAPARAVHNALHVIETTSQQRDLRAPWRFPHLTIQPHFAVAAAVGLLAIGAGLIILRGPQSQIGHPSPSPTTLNSPSPRSVSAGALQATWASVGSRVYPSFDYNGPIAFSIDSTKLRFSGFRYDVDSTWSLTGDGGQVLLNFQTTYAGLPDGDPERWDCQVGDEGTYDVDLSEDRGTLTLSAVSDACAPRAPLLAGEWTRWACPDPNFCELLTDQSAGRHVAPIFKPFEGATSGRFAYTVPAGWLKAIVPPTWPETELASNVRLLIRRAPNDTGIDLFSNVDMGSWETVSDEPLDCVATAPKLNASPAEVATWLASLHGLLVTAPEPVSIGGLSGVLVDLSFTPGWTDPCAYSQSDGGPAIYAGRRTLFHRKVASAVVGEPASNYDEGLSATDDEWARYILLDRGDGQILLIRIQTEVKAIWEALLVDAMPVVESFEFIR